MPLTVRARAARVLAFLVLTISSPAATSGMKLAPKGTRVEQAVARQHASWFERTVLKIAGGGIDQFTEPVHEEITQRIFGCDGKTKHCLDSEFASPYILAGVRWNDDPPFRLEPGGPKVPGSCKVQETIRFTTQPLCWAALFKNAAEEAARGRVFDESSHAPLLHRSHFGDLQFIHGMASRLGEAPESTRDDILGWAEFAWRVDGKELGLEVAMSAVPVARVADRFRQSGLRVQDLYTLGNQALRRYVNDVAFGSLLHLVQDSFAGGHVERRDAIAGQTCPGLSTAAPGAIVEFHVYGAQNAKKHSHYDTAKALEAALLTEHPHVIDVGRVLLEYRERGADWETVKPYIECVFRLEDARPASAGAGFGADD